jgi:hypothetical protein
MNLLIDTDGASRVEQVNAVGDRTYYTTRKGDLRLVLLALRDGLTLERLTGQVVDATLGWDGGTEGFVRPSDEGREHTKVTIFKVVGGGRFRKTLSEVMAAAPRRY